MCQYLWLYTFMNWFNRPERDSLRHQCVRIQGDVVGISIPSASHTMHSSPFITCSSPFPPWAVPSDSWGEETGGSASFGINLKGSQWLRIRHLTSIPIHGHWKIGQIMRIHWILGGYPFSDRYNMSMQSTLLIITVPLKNVYLKSISLWDKPCAYVY